jgi:hypothetical protein
MIVHKDGNFRIEHNTVNAHERPYMACHECEANKGKSGWAAFCFRPEFVSKACLMCGEHAPDGFQAVYWMLTSDFPK